MTELYTERHGMLNHNFQKKVLSLEQFTDILSLNMV